MSANVFELVCYNRYRQARLVLEAGGDPNFRNERQETPLMACVMFIREPDRRTQLIRMLIGFGADVNAVNDKGQTVMMYACILNQIDSVLVLIDQEQIDLNLGDITGNTCLMYACAMERGSMVYVFLELYRTRQRTVNIYQRNHVGQSAREIAEQKGFGNIVELFTDAVDSDYWSSYYELSRNMAHKKSYPLKIEESNGMEDLEDGVGDKLNVGDPSNPLAYMVEHVLQVSNGGLQDPTDGSAQPDFSRHDSIGGSSMNTTTSTDGLVDTEMAGTENGRNKTGNAECDDVDSMLRSSKENGLLEISDENKRKQRANTARRRNLKSRQSGKSKSSVNSASRHDDGSQARESRLSRQDSFRKSSGSSRQRPSTQASDFQPNRDESMPQSFVPNMNGDSVEIDQAAHRNQSPTRIPQSQRINYYTRHDINHPEGNFNPKTTTTEAADTYPRPPRAPSRSGSRVRRRKTTEVCVTVSDGKIVPYNPGKKKIQEDLQRYSENTDEPYQGQVYNNNVAPSNPPSVPQPIRKEGNFDESPRVSVRSRKKRDNRLARHVDAGNPGDLEGASMGHPVTNSRTYDIASSFDVDSYTHGESYPRDLVQAWNSGGGQIYGQNHVNPSAQYEVNYDIVTGLSESQSRTSGDGNYTYGRPSSRHIPRRKGSFRAIAW